jgi:hypothetical protein
MASLTTVVNSCARVRLGEDAAEHVERMEAAIGVLRQRGFIEVQAKSLLFTAEVFILAGDDAAATRCLNEARGLIVENREVVFPQQLRRVEGALAARL